MEGRQMRCFEHIAKLIKTKRMGHPKGYSQSELSNLLGYKNGQFISNVERALCNIPLKMLSRVSEILDIDPEELREVILKDQDLTIRNYLKMAPQRPNSPRRSKPTLTVANGSGIKTEEESQVRELPEETRQGA